MPTEAELIRRAAALEAIEAKEPEIVPKPVVQVVNASQPVRSALIQPDPAYSRQIALELHVPGGIGGDDFCYTPTLGNTLVLHGIDLWMRSAYLDTVFGGFVYLMYGAGVPNTDDEIIDTWLPIVPLWCGQKPGFRLFYFNNVELHFSMKKKFIKDEIRFAAVMENFGAEAWEAHVVFEISEG